MQCFIDKTMLELTMESQSFAKTVSCSTCPSVQCHISRWVLIKINFNTRLIMVKYELERHHMYLRKVKFIESNKALCIIVLLA